MEELLKSCFSSALWIQYFPAKNLWFSRAWHWVTPHTENWKNVVWLWWGRWGGTSQGHKERKWNVECRGKKYKMCIMGTKWLNSSLLPSPPSSCIQEGSLPWKHRKYQIWATREAFLVGSKLEVALFSPKAWGYTMCLISSWWHRVWMEVLFRVMCGQR